MVGIAVSAESLWWSVLAPLGVADDLVLSVVVPDLAIPDDVLDLQGSVVLHDPFSSDGSTWVWSDFLCEC